MENSSTSNVLEAFTELRNTIWMLAIPLILGLLTLFGSLQWIIQDLRWENQFSEREVLSTSVIEEVEASKCDQPRPLKTGTICAQSTDWWVVVDSTDCVGGQCYSPVHLVDLTEILEEMETSYIPLLIPGLIPLIFLFVVIMKIKKARRALQIAIDAHRPTHPSI